MAQTLTVLVQADPFAGKAEKAAQYVPGPDYRARGGTLSPSPTSAANSDQALLLEELRNAPRPVLGVSVKPNTPAYAQVLTKDGDVIDLLGSARPDNSPDGRTTTKSWTGWFLQSVREDRMEKTQLVETFGDAYLYTYGEKPRSLAFQGVLLNTDDYDWRTDFWQNWEANFRASRLVEKQARMYVRFDDLLVEGYPINATVGQTADTPNMMPFSFMFFVTNYVYLRTTSPRETQRTLAAGANLNLAYDQSLQTINLQRQYSGLAAGVDKALGLASQAGLSELARDAILGTGDVTPGQYLKYLAASGGIGLGFDALRAVRDAPQGVAGALLAGALQQTSTLAKYLVAQEVAEQGVTLGEFNYWFGRASELTLFSTDLLESASRASGLSAALPAVPGLSDAALYARGFLVEGSVDRIIDRLAYSVLTEGQEALSPKPTATASLALNSAEQALTKNAKPATPPANTLELGL